MVKIGSSLLVDEKGLKTEWLDALAADLAALAAGRRDLLVVSSGAIALGRRVLDLPRGVLKLEESQAAAAVGQIALARAWAEMLQRHGFTAGQILLTLGDTEERRRYLNARSTIAHAAQTRRDPGDQRERHGGDLGDPLRRQRPARRPRRHDDGRRPPRPSFRHRRALHGAAGANPHATFLPRVARITPEIEAMAGTAGSELSRGGMQTKVEAGKIATAAGTAMVIASGRELHPLRAIAEGARCTWFAADANPVTARKTWISGKLETHGTLVIDDGAVRALRSGKSLLPAGVRKVEGRFQRGDAVAILGPNARRDRPRPRRLRCRRRRAHRRAEQPGDRNDPRLCRSRRDDPPRRHGASRRLARRIACFAFPEVIR